MSLQQKKSLTRYKGNLWKGRKYSQTTYLIRGQYPKYKTLTQFNGKNKTKQNKTTVLRCIFQIIVHSVIYLGKWVTPISRYFNYRCFHVLDNHLQEYSYSFTHLSQWQILTTNFPKPKSLWDSSSFGFFNYFLTMYNLI